MKPLVIVLGIIATLGIAPACHRATAPRAEEPATPEIARLRLEKEGARRARLSGQYTARGQGLAGLLSTAELDVLVEMPARAHVAVRSFFDQPLWILATDGATLTGFDATSPTGPRWFSGPADGTAFGELLGVSLWPNDLVALLLGIAPAAGSEALQLAVDTRRGTYEVGLREPQGTLSIVTARVYDDCLLRWRRYEPSGALLFDVLYESLLPVGDTTLGTELIVRLPNASDEVPGVLRLSGREMEINGLPFPEEAFRLAPPARTQVEPLTP
ncbi:MAG: hypothetical protein ACO3JL_02045 [Myxococcota bacterium]